MCVCSALSLSAGFHSGQSDCRRTHTHTQTVRANGETTVFHQKALMGCNAEHVTITHASQIINLQPDKCTHIHSHFQTEASDLLPNDTQVHKGKRSLCKEKFSICKFYNLERAMHASTKMKLNLISAPVRSSTEQERL